MSSQKFQYKRIGYLAAAQSFNKDTDVLMLCTNLIKKVFFQKYYSFLKKKKCAINILI